MKNIFIIILTLISFNSFAQSGCSYKHINSTGITIAVPVYTANVLYYFDDFEKKAMAQVQWAFDEDATSLCLKEFKATRPTAKIMLPEMDFPSLEVEVAHGLKRASLSILTEASGQYHGQTDFIPVNYRAKAEIVSSIKDKKLLVSVQGKMKYQYESIQKEVVAEFDCTKNAQDRGVVAFHRRLGELISKITKFNTDEKVVRDDVLEDFLGTCVEFEDSDSENFVGLSRKAKLVKAKLPVHGFVRSYQKESMDAFQASVATYIEF